MEAFHEPSKVPTGFGLPHSKTLARPAARRRFMVLMRARNGVEALHKKDWRLLKRHSAVQALRGVFGVQLFFAAGTETLRVCPRATPASAAANRMAEKAHSTRNALLRGFSSLRMPASSEYTRNKNAPAAKVQPVISSLFHHLPPPLWLILFATLNSLINGPRPTRCSSASR